MWKKMTRQGGGVDGVFDAVALRVVLKAKRGAEETDEAYEAKSRQLCYHVSWVGGAGRCVVLRAELGARHLFLVVASSWLLSPVTGFLW